MIQRPNSKRLIVITWSYLACSSFLIHSCIFLSSQTLLQDKTDTILKLLSIYMYCLCMELVWLLSAKFNLLNHFGYKNYCFIFKACWVAFNNCYQTRQSKVLICLSLDFLSAGYIVCKSPVCKSPFTWKLLTILPKSASDLCNFVHLKFNIDISFI